LKMKSINNLPVFLKPSAQIVGRVVKTVIGDNYRIAYLVIDPGDGALKLINNKELEITPDAVLIHDIDCMKSYSHGEELSVYQLKVGDVVFDNQGRELGIVSDFVLDISKKKVQGVEISSGAIQDILQGRQDIDLEKLHWASEKSVLADEGRDLT
jgi:sporulation protein YlmC with PRC-barrel domain